MELTRLIKESVTDIREILEEIQLQNNEHGFMGTMAAYGHDPVKKLPRYVAAIRRAGKAKNIDLPNKVVAHYLDSPAGRALADIHNEGGVTNDQLHRYLSKHIPNWLGVYDPKEYGGPEEVKEAKSPEHYKAKVAAANADAETHGAHQSPESRRAYRNAMRRSRYNYKKAYPVQEGAEYGDHKVYDKKGNHIGTVSHGKYQSVATWHGTINPRTASKDQWSNETDSKLLDHKKSFAHNKKEGEAWIHQTHKDMLGEAIFHFRIKDGNRTIVTKGANYKNKAHAVAVARFHLPDNSFRVHKGHPKKIVEAFKGNVANTLSAIDKADAKTALKPGDKVTHRGGLSGHVKRIHPNGRDVYFYAVKDGQRKLFKTHHSSLMAEAKVVAPNAPAASDAAKKRVSDKLKNKHWNTRHSTNQIDLAKKDARYREMERDHSDWGDWQRNESVNESAAEKGEMFSTNAVRADKARGKVRAMMRDKIPAREASSRLSGLVVDGQLFDVVAMANKHNPDSDVRPAIKTRLKQLGIDTSNW